MTDTTPTPTKTILGPLIPPQGGEVVLCYDIQMTADQAEKHKMDLLLWLKNSDLVIRKIDDGVRLRHGGLTISNHLHNKFKVVLEKRSSKTDFESSQVVAKIE